MLQVPVKCFDKRLVDNQRLFITAPDEHRALIVAHDFIAVSAARHLRRHPDDQAFGKLAQAGLLLTGVPESMGGLWSGISTSTRAICELLRIVAQADSSVARVAVMHPPVLSLRL